MSIFSGHHYSSRLPRILVAVLSLLIFTLLLSYTRVSSATYSILWPEPERLSLDPGDDLSTVFDDISEMSYGKARRPPMKGMPDKIVAELPDKFIPSHGGPTKRLVIVGDVHGQKPALEDLLEKIHFDKAKDHLILSGDLINKGPDSAGVVDLAMELGAHAVRGNHEDRVLLVSAAMEKGPAPQKPAAGTADHEARAYKRSEEEKDQDGKEQEDPKAAKEEYLAHEALLDRGDKPEFHTARSLRKRHVEWLSQLPVILKVGRIPADRGLPAAFDNMVVVHGGLVPNVSLADQDPWAVMTMRTLVYPVDKERRKAVRRFLEDKAKKRHRGSVAAMQIDEDEVDVVLQKVMAAEGMSPDHAGDDVAVPTDGREGSKWWKEWNRFQERLAKTTIAAAEEAEAEAEAESESEAGAGAPAAAAHTSAPATDDNKLAAAADAAHKKTKKGRKKDKKRRPQTAVEKELSGMTVVYGHDAKSGLTVPDTHGKGKGHTYGLDSGCVYGRKLSALVIEARPGGVVHGITQVKCEMAVAP